MHALVVQKLMCGKKLSQLGTVRRNFSGKRPAQGPGQIPAKDRTKAGKRLAKDQINTGILPGLSSKKTSGTITGT